MGIDSIGAGFNPHLLSDQSPVNAAVASLVLPSAFRPVPDPSTPTGSRWVMDSTLLVSREVTDEDPFTVTYKIRPEAQWTDNAPIGADDFWYLWRQMVTQPGVVDPAGYNLITGVQSIDGGKHKAVVTFSERYPAWRELFTHILPAHIVKDAPGGFSAGLARAMPVTGGQFRVENIDPQRDEILLARNDRFWAAQALPDHILMRRAGAPAALADSMRNGDTQVAQVHGGAAAFAQLSAISDVRTARTMTPRTMQLSLRAVQPKLADGQVRQAILGLLDVDLLAAVGAGSDNTVTLARRRRRSQPELPLPLGSRRTPRRLLVSRAAPAVGARDALRAPPDPAPAPRGHHLVPPVAARGRQVRWIALRRGAVQPSRRHSAATADALPRERLHLAEPGVSPGTTSFVVELPAGTLGPRGIARFTRAVVTVAHRNGDPAGARRGRAPAGQLHPEREVVRGSR